MDIYPYHVMGDYRVYSYASNNIRVFRGDGKSTFLRSAKGETFRLCAAIEAGDITPLYSLLASYHYRDEHRTVAHLFSHK